MAGVEHEPSALLGSADPRINFASLVELGQVSSPFGLVFPLIVRNDFLRAPCSPSGVGKRADLSSELSVSTDQCI